MDFTQITQLGAAAGAVIVTYLFLRYMKGEAKENRLLLTNHLSKHTELLQILIEQSKEHRKNTEK